MGSYPAVRKQNESPVYVHSLQVHQPAADILCMLMLLRK